MGLGDGLDHEAAVGEKFQVFVLVEVGGVAVLSVKEFGPAVAAGFEVGLGEVGAGHGGASGSVALGHLGALGGDGRTQLGRLDDFDVGAEAENPPRDVVEIAQREGHLDGAAGEIGFALRVMPSALDDVMRALGADAEFYDDGAVAGQDTEGRAEVGRGIEIGWALKRGLRYDRIAAAGEDVGAQCVFIAIPGDQHPAVGHAREVQRMEPAGRERWAPFGLILEAQLELAEERETHSTKDYRVDATRAGGAHGDETVERLLHGVAAFTEQAAGDFVEGRAQFCAKIDAFENIQRLTRDDEGDTFVLAEVVPERKRRVRIPVAERPRAVVVFDGKFELVAEIANVALDRFGGGVESVGERGAVDATVAAGGGVELIVDLEQTREGDFGGLLVGAYRRFHGDEDTELTPPRDG